MISGVLDKYKIKWHKPPHGARGEGVIEVEGHGKINVSWRREGGSLWVEFADRVAGFDFGGSRNDQDALEYQVAQRMTGAVWAAKRFVRDGENITTEAGGSQKKIAKVKSQMPGKVIKLFVEEGQTVQKGDPLMVLEAMKMENEIKAPQSGRVTSVKVSAGQSVETGAELLKIEA